MGNSVELNFRGGKKIDATIGDVVIQTDQSISNGGEGSAPEPFNLFLASIATCAGVYALNFCHSRKLSTEGMALTMTCDRDPESKRFKKMTVHLKLPEIFPEKYIAGIVRAMDLCAVKRHIVNPPEFDIEIT